MKIAIKIITFVLLGVFVVLEDVIGVPEALHQGNDRHALRREAFAESIQLALDLLTCLLGGV